MISKVNMIKKVFSHFFFSIAFSATETIIVAGNASNNNAKESHENNIIIIANKPIKYRIINVFLRV